MILNCGKLSYPLWEEVQLFLEQFLVALVPEFQQNQHRIFLTYRNIIYHEPLPIIQQIKAPKATQKVLLLLFCEIKRDLYYRRVTFLTEADRQPDQKLEISTLKRRHILYATIQKVISYLQYLGTVTWRKQAHALTQGLAIHKDNVLLNDQF